MGLIINFRYYFYLFDLLYFCIMDENALLLILISLVTFGYLLERILEYLNLKNQKKEIPQDFKDFYDQDKYNKSLEYHKEVTRFSWLGSTISFLVTLSVLVFGLFGYLDEVLRSYIQSEIWLSLAFFGVVFILSDILSLPFQIYSTFVIEEKYGFNKTTPKIFIMDKLKGYLLSSVIGGVLLYLLLSLITGIGENFWWWFWLVAVAFTVFMNMFYTSLLLPLFNKLTPLEEGDLRTSIENYSKKVGFPLTNIMVIDGSKRSTKANAFFSGLGRKKKIVLYDTLINNHTNEELVAVLAHEVGHYKKNHILWGLVTAILQIGLMLYIMSLMIFNESLSFALGGDTLALHLNLIAFGMLYSPVSMVLGLLGNVMSRKNEFEADAYAATTYDGQALQKALKKLSVDNLSNLFPHPAYVFFHYSHPPLVKRLRSIDQYASGA